MRSIERPNPTWDYDGDRILGHVGQKVILWDTTTGKVLQKFQGHEERLFAVRFSPDGIHAISSSWVEPGEIMYKSKDTRTILWNLATGENKAVFQDQVAGEFSPDGKRLVTFSARPEKLGWFDAVVWDAAQGSKIAEAKLEDASSPRRDTLHFAPDGSTFAHIMAGVGLLTNPSFGVLYDARDGREIGRSPLNNGHYYTTGGHHYTSNGTLVSLEKDSVMVTDLKAGRIQSIPHSLKYPPDGVKSFWGAAWTHDGKKVAALPYGGGEIKIWDIESKIATIGVTSHPVTLSVAIISPDNKRLTIEAGANVEDHPDLRLYDMNTGKELARIELAQWGHVIGFSPDSKTILVGGKEFVIYDSENGRKISSVKLLDDVSFSHDWNK